MADINGDFKIQFSDRHGDFYCWLNTNMMETRQILETSDLDGFEKRRLPSPGLQVEVVILDHDAPIPRKKAAEGTAIQSTTAAKEASTASILQVNASTEGSNSSQLVDGSDDAKGNTVSGNDSGVQEDTKVAVPGEISAGDHQGGDSSKAAKAIDAEKVEGSLGEGKTTAGVGSQSDSKDTGVLSRHDASPRSGAVAPSDFKAIAAASAADASVFTFGDDDDYDSEEELQ